MPLSEASCSAQQLACESPPGVRLFVWTSNITAGHLPPKAASTHRNCCLSKPAMPGENRQGEECNGSSGFAWMSYCTPQWSVLNTMEQSDDHRGLDSQSVGQIIKQCAWLDASEYHMPAWIFQSLICLRVPI